MDLIDIICISIMGVLGIVMLIAASITIIKCNFDIKKNKKEIKDLYQHPIWDEFIKMAEDGQFVYSPENSIKGSFEVFILKNKNNTPRYRFVKLGNGRYAIFNYPSISDEEPTCVLSSFNIAKARKMYDILKPQVK